MSAQIIEHVVLYRLKDDADEHTVNAMISAINGLNSIDQVLNLTGGSLLRIRSPPSLPFTHMLYGRYASREDLTAYSLHPNHVSVVNQFRPILEDIMAIDWVVDGLSGPPEPIPGSAIRFTFLKLRENEKKDEILEFLGGVYSGLSEITQLTFGENFSAARSKGFSVASAVVFPGTAAMEVVDSNDELKQSVEEKLEKYAESVIVVDFVVPSPENQPESEQAQKFCCAEVK